MSGGHFLAKAAQQLCCKLVVVAVRVKREGHSRKCPSLLQFSPRPFDVKRPGIRFAIFYKRTTIFLAAKGRKFGFRSFSKEKQSFVQKA
jgi:hypothetical protein